MAFQAHIIIVPCISKHALGNTKKIQFTVIHNSNNINIAARLNLYWIAIQFLTIFTYYV